MSLPGYILARIRAFLNGPALEPPALELAAPVDPLEAAGLKLDPVARALSMVGKGTYYLGTGDYRPHNGKDVPWTTGKAGTGSDCAGFAFSWCHGIPRHRPGYNRGGSVVDWINTDSAIDDACGLIDDRTGKLARAPTRDIFDEVFVPLPGDLLVYGSVRKDGRRMLIGHVGIIVGVPAKWDMAHPRFDRLDVVQCRGPSGRKPGVVRTSGSTWTRHDVTWADGEKPWRRSRMLRVRQSEPVAAFLDPKGRGVPV